MKGVNKGGVDKSGVDKHSGDKSISKKITAENFVAIHRRIDQCLPMETVEWCKLEQLLMQVTEFAPTSLVYQIGMAAAVYADNQAQRAYLLGKEDASRASKSRKSINRTSQNSQSNQSNSAKAIKANKSVA